MSNLLSVIDVAEKLDVTTQYIRKLIRNGDLRGMSVGKQWVIEQDDFDTYLEKNNLAIVPRDHKRNDNTVPNIIALSFFSGAMGLDIGMKKAGINAILACEFNKYCKMTINKNAPNMALIGDINQYTGSEILEFANIPKGKTVDVIFGGPPCQAFSTAGAGRAFDDERGNVFLKFIDIVGEIKPKYVVIENVRGLLSAAYPYKDVRKPFKGGALLIILDKLRNYGYNISFNLYNSANYGAPQIRERVVLIGKLHGKKMPYLVPTHSDNPQYNLKKWRTLKDAFKNVPNDVKHHHLEFPEKRLKYYRMLSEGQYWKHLPVEVQKEALGNVYFLGGGKTGFFRKLSYEKPSPTLVTNPAMPATDLCHPTYNRPISVEEYKAIQEFPSDWQICGPLTEQYKQIGNAVPIKLGEAIGQAIIKDMNGMHDDIPNDFKFSRYCYTDDVSWELKTRKEYAKLLNKQNNENIDLFAQ